jgi:hypothetical protein
LALTLNEIHKQQIGPGSFLTLCDLSAHWGFESIWWQRLKLQEQIIVLHRSSNPDMREVAEIYSLVHLYNHGTYHHGQAVSA